MVIILGGHVDAGGFLPRQAGWKGFYTMDGVLPIYSHVNIIIIRIVPLMMNYSYYITHAFGLAR